MATPQLDRMRRLHDLLAPERLTRIVDIGASPINVPPYRDLFVAGLCELVCFEPQPSEFEALSRAKADNQHLVQAAVGDGTRGTLHLCGSVGFTSLLRPNPKFTDYIGRWRPKTRVVETIPLDTARLDDLTEVGRFDLLKIDVQGSEAAVFTHGRDSLRQSLAVYTEVAFAPLYEDQPLVDTQMSVLRGLGFEAHKLMPPKRVMINTRLTKSLDAREHLNQLVDADMIFVRNLLDLKNEETEALKHLAVLADGVFASFDLVLYVLDILAGRGVVVEEAVQAYLRQLGAVR